VPGRQNIKRECNKQIVVSRALWTLPRILRVDSSIEVNMLAFPALLLVATASGITAAPSQPKGLNVLAQQPKPSRYVGVATESYNILNATTFGREYAKIATSDEFGIYTNENALKW
jgi:hypothetical protein